jgi:transposase
MRRRCELQTIRTGIVSNRTEWKNRIGSGLGDSIATSLAAATSEHSTAQIEAVDKAIRETIDQDDELRSKCNLLLSVVGVGETLAASLLAEMPAPEVLRRRRDGRLCRAQSEPPPVRHLD